MFRDDAFYRKVVESSNVAMVVVGIDAIVRHHTRAAALMLTGKDSDLVGQAFSSFLAPDSQDGIAGFLRRVSASQAEIVPFVAACTLAEDDERFIEMTAVNLVDSPEVAGIVVSLTDRTELRRALEIETRKANFDALTGLLNLRAFEDQGRELFKDGVAGHAFVALFDVDHLKAYNDQFGHELGDNLLRCVAARLSAVVGAAGVVGRIGGDEFGVVLPGIDQSTATHLLEAACQAIQAPMPGMDVVVTATCGAASSTMAQHWAGLMHRADTALYDGKTGKRGGVYFFRGDEPGWDQRRQRQREALLAAEQAVVDLRSDILRLEQETRHDQRTGLLNAAAFEEDLPLLHARAVQDGTSYAIVLCDIDFFHNYNQRYLYQPANVTLRRVADAINAACRPGDPVYRYGGEEIVITLWNTALPEACEVGERVRAAVAELALPHDSRADAHEVVTISVGVAATCTDQATPAGVVDAANRALIVAKRAGRNRVECAADA